MSGKKYYRRPAKDRVRKKRPEKDSSSGYWQPKIDPVLKTTFQKIGVPDRRPFRPDPFQLEALELIADYDVLVSAPTGSGKTWIATQAIRSCLTQGRRVWYASPLKALSNTIYQEFCHEFGSDSCGILTGDRKENTDAPIIIGTTEILRNQLYDVMHSGTSIRTDLVILDEAHYLSDPDRGVVWEEVLIYLPSRVRLLLLSATISNAEEVCEWLKEVRGTPNRVVKSRERPVSMKMLFLFSDGLIVPLGAEKGLNPKVKKFLASQKGAGNWRRQIDFGKIIECLREVDLLPAIFFLKSRMDCDRALLTCSQVDGLSDVRMRLEGVVGAFLQDYPHIKEHRQMSFLLKSRVASHHGGQLPYWKILVEKMMKKGFLDAIFSTSTVAAGVNFPARTVALVQSDRYNGREFADLTATEFHQMVGRAGRRGKDNIGFTLVIPGRHQDPKLIHGLEHSSPEPILSRIHINFSMTLNLLLSHTPVEIKDLFERSFAAFQEKDTRSFVKIQWDEMVSDLEKILRNGKCDISDPYEVMNNIQIRSELQKEIKSLTRSVHDRQLADSYKKYLVPGRLFLHKNGDVYMAFKTYEHRGRFICAAYNIKKAFSARKGRFRLIKADMNQISTIFDYLLDIPDELTLKSMKGVYNLIPWNDLQPLKIEAFDQDISLEELEDVRQRLKGFVCEGCRHLKVCHRKKRGDLRNLLQDFRLLEDQMDAMGGGLWSGFKRHLLFLKDTGFVDDTDRLTPDGYWASNLRLDHPLLIAEAIRKGALGGLSPHFLAGSLAPFVWDRDQDVVLKVSGISDLAGLEGAFNKILYDIERIRSLKEKRGFENPLILFWPAVALFSWAKGVSWEQLLDLVPVNEGDMASLIMRTADHLRQVINLKETHAQLASVAGKAVDLIQREPVFIP